MGILTKLAHRRFWLEWQDRFEDENKEFITPQNPTVLSAANKAVGNRYSNDLEKAIDVWQWVWDNVEYELSDTWYTPEETIKNGVGDCEDVTFLVASMLPIVGVEESKMGIGYIRFPDGYTEPHTWNIVDGNVVDATGAPNLKADRKYIKRNEYTIRSV